MTNFAISVTSDTVCPWCYIGKKKLESGIALYKSKHPDSSDTFTTTWLPYQLNPKSPSPGVDKRQYMSSLFGPERLPVMEARLAQAGKPVGIPFNFGGKTGNTKDSHRLLYMARQKAGAETQNKVVDELFKLYFENEGDITDHANLTQAAIKSGLNGDEVQDWLASGAGRDEVEREILGAQKRKVTGVPNFVLQEKYELGGAQDADAFVTAFEKIKEVESK